MAVIRERNGESIKVLATDPESFGGAPEFLTKPLSRVEWRARSGLKRLVWLAKEGAGILVMALVPALPKPVRRRVGLRLAKLSRRTWLIELASAHEVFGVGGGYLGDRYLRESLVTALSYRFARSLGAHVETMPLSISSCKSRLLQIALRSTSGVVWRVRERTSEAIFNSLDLQPRLSPDLAWLDAGEPVSRAERHGILAAPVGSNFYVNASDEPKLWPALETVLKSQPVDTTVRLLPMHSYTDRLGDGGDDRACLAISRLLARRYPKISVEILNPGDYAAVRAAMAASEYAICERLHAALAAVTTATPVQIISYEPKHLGVMSLAGLPFLCDEQQVAFSVEPSVIEQHAHEQRTLLEKELL